MRSAAQTRLTKGGSFRRLSGARSFSEQNGPFPGMSGPGRRVYLARDSCNNPELQHNSLWQSAQDSRNRNRIMGSLKKRRKAKINKHKRRKKLRAHRHKKRTWQK
jgi:hypothetical protein